MRIGQFFTYSKDYREINITLRASPRAHVHMEVHARKVADGTKWNMATVTYDNPQQLIAMQLEDTVTLIKLLEQALFWTTCLDASIPAGWETDESWDKVIWFGRQVPPSFQA